ncbi:hypothetical protein XPA_000853 [Xanthoria parietina]
MASSYKPRFTTTLNAAARASSAAQAETMILLLSRFDDLSTMTDPVASRKSSASIMESYIRALATATPAARSPRVVVVPTAAKRVAAATSTVLADPERLGREDAKGWEVAMAYLAAGMDGRGGTGDAGNGV